ncbi:hypothetical protein L484_005839 [Morus notabilis]|uniref:Uncharacterized protein n=1 Tax=Morus notabilis TaxID=981085 RepID=W9QFC1_9ROSA|nr:hypothetical protein L484_005839 [Morus notabilis]
MQLFVGVCQSPLVSATTRWPTYSSFPEIPEAKAMSPHSSPVIINCDSKSSCHFLQLEILVLSDFCFHGEQRRCIPTIERGKTRPISAPIVAGEVWVQRSQVLRVLTFFWQIGHRYEKATSGRYSFHQVLQFGTRLP